MDDWSVEYYTKSDGSSPVEEFIDSLDESARAKAIFVIDVLRMKGTQLREPYSKSIQGIGKLFELRFRTAGNAYRIFYFPVTGKRFILLHGFVKKTEKTPRGELTIALQRMNDWILRKGN
jgi:phage-related protein